MPTDAYVHKIQVQRSEDSTEFHYELRYKQQPASDFTEAARRLRDIYADDLELRVFGDLHERDLIILMLDISVDARAVLKNDQLYSTAVAAFSREFHATELELGLPPFQLGASPLENARNMASNRTGAPDLAAMAMALSQEAATGHPDSELQQPATRLDDYNEARKDRKLIKQYTQNGRFDLLLFLAKERERFAVPLRMGKRFLIDLPSEGVSESTFSIHAQFASDLRKNMSPRNISNMVFCNRNDALLFSKIQRKIKDAYMAKHGANELNDEA